jgi:hypothetical protein
MDPYYGVAFGKGIFAAVGFVCDVLSPLLKKLQAGENFPTACSAIY